MMRAIRTKLRSVAGESLGETAASLLVASLAMLMLAGSVVTSGQINAQADDTTTLAEVVPESYEPGTVDVTMTYGDHTSTYKDAELYNAGGLYYYEPHSEEAGS